MWELYRYKQFFLKTVIHVKDWSRIRRLLFPHPEPVDVAPLSRSQQNAVIKKWVGWVKWRGYPQVYKQYYRIL